MEMICLRLFSNKMRTKIFILVFVVLIINTIATFGQIPVANPPQPATFSRGVIIGNSNNGNYPSPNIPAFPNLNSNNRQSLDIYERDGLEVQRRNMEMQRMREEDFADFLPDRRIRYDLPSRAGAQGTEYYYRTAEKLLDMLRGKTPLDLKEAVFSVENAYFEERLDRKEYEKGIAELVAIAKLKAKQDGYNWNNPVTKNMMLFRVMADTLTVKLPLQERSTVSYPMLYDFDDFMGEKDHTKLFVTKLLATRTGQCYSMPLLYLILCEAVGAEASLALSPNHTYIKFKDRQNNWYNLELTNGRMTTDAHIIGSGFISAAAIKNGLYMNPQTKRQTIAHCLSGLAVSYIHKYGYDRFVMQCADSILHYAPGNTGAMAIKSNYQTQRLQYVIRQTGYPPLDTLKVRFPKAYGLLNEVKALYREMDNSGYREMPKEAYEVWLKSANEEKARREHNEKYNRVLQFVK
jgi:hypothetical protein